jgi:hypothetical protein
VLISPASLWRSKPATEGTIALTLKPNNRFSNCGILLNSSSTPTAVGPNKLTTNTLSELLNKTALILPTNIKDDNLLKSSNASIFRGEGNDVLICFDNKNTNIKKIGKGARAFIAIIELKPRDIFSASIIATNLITSDITAVVCNSANIINP